MSARGRAKGAKQVCVCMCVCACVCARPVRDLLRPWLQKKQKRGVPVLSDEGRQCSEEVEAALAAGSLSGCTVQTLRGYLRAVGLPLSGLKAAIVERVQVRAGRVVWGCRGNVEKRWGQEASEAGLHECCARQTCM